MISYLKGKILDIDDNHFTVGVGDDRVVGYDVKAPMSESYQRVKVGDETEFFIYTHVKEDLIQLFGFLEKQEKELFCHLLQVNGVGPKAALSILSHVKAQTLIQSLLNQKPEMIGKIPGVGKKTLERMFIDLVGPIQKKVESGRFQFQSTQMQMKGSQKQSGASYQDSALVGEAKTALTALGFKESDFLSVLNTVVIEGNSLRVEDLVKDTLKRLR